jgi:Flp pilus assembly protein TadG
MIQRILTQRTRLRRAQRRGVATVELAVCLPVLLLLVVGAIEGSNFIFLKQAVTAAAYESAQVVTRVGGTKANADVRANQILTARSIDKSTISYSPSNPNAAGRGELITVSVSAPVSPNSIGLDWIFDKQTVTASVRMLKD